MARDETTMTGEKITDEQIRQQYRENRETPGLDTLMIAIHSQDSERRVRGPPGMLGMEISDGNRRPQRPDGGTNE